MYMSAARNVYGDLWGFRRPINLSVSQPIFKRWLDNKIIKTDNWHCFQTTRKILCTCQRLVMFMVIHGVFVDRL